MANSIDPDQTGPSGSVSFCQQLWNFRTFTVPYIYPTRDEGEHIFAPGPITNLVLSLRVDKAWQFRMYMIFAGVVGWCEGAVYLTSLGRPTDIGLQLGKACYPCSG